MKRILGFGAIALILCLWMFGSTQSRTTQNEFKEVETAAGKMKLVVTSDTPESRARTREAELRNAYNNVSIETFRLNALIGPKVVLTQ